MSKIVLTEIDLQCVLNGSEELLSYATTSAGVFTLHTLEVRHLSPARRTTAPSAARPHRRLEAEAAIIAMLLTSIAVTRREQAIR